MDGKDWKEYKAEQKERRLTQHQKRQNEVLTKLRELNIPYVEGNYSFVITYGESVIDIWYTKMKFHVRGTNKYPHISLLWDELQKRVKHN